MDEDARTLWCGNLSEKVTEDILYELFLQGGPVERVCIPRDRDGKQRPYGFVTYKHMKSVPYALKLFYDTALFNRSLIMKWRKNIDTAQFEKVDQPHHLDQVLQSGHEMTLSNIPSDMSSDMAAIIALRGANSYSNHLKYYPIHEDRKSRRTHPYYHDHNDRVNGTYRNDRRPYRSKHTPSHSRDYSRRNNPKNGRSKYY